MKWCYISLDSSLLFLIYRMGLPKVLSVLDFILLTNTRVNGLSSWNFLILFGRKR